METRRVNLVASWVLLCGSTAWGACNVANLYIDSAEDIAGCYQESAFGGMSQTTVWTLDGLDVVEAGTAGIAAELGDDASTGDPIWKIGKLIANPPNTWSEGLDAGLVVDSIACMGTSAFWETEDPTEEVQWQCDTNEDGAFTNAESDFTVTCGCPGDPVVESTPTPSTATTAAQPTLAPATVSDPPTSTTPVPIAESLTPAPVLFDDGRGAVAPPTPAPISGVWAPAALACNITFSSESLQDVAGCYVGRASADSSSRGIWVTADGSATIVWKDDDENWAIVLFGVGGPDEVRCLSNDDTQDPTEIDIAQWKCDTDRDFAFSTSERGDFGGLECTGDCTATTSLEAVGDDDSSGGSGTKSTLIAGSVVGGLVLAGLLIIVLFAVKRSHEKKKAQGMEGPADAEAAGTPTMATGAPDASEAPAAVPVFEPWGTRPPPRYYA